MDDYQDERRQCPLPHREDRIRYSWDAAGTSLCGGHVRGLDSQLDGLPKLYELLAKAHLSRGVSIGNGSRSAEKPLPINPKVTEHRGRIIGVLASWTMMAAEQRGVTDPAKYEMADMVRFLRRHQDWIVTQEWVEDFAVEVSDLHHAAKHLIWPDRQQTRTRLPCPNHPCEGVLRPVDDKDIGNDDLLPEGLICTTCGIIVRPGEWRKLARDVHDMSGLLTEQDVLLWAEITGYRLAGPTIRQWATRGHIGRHEKDGRTLYDLDEIQARLDERNAEAA